MTPPLFRALTIAGSDPSGGAGLQGDLAVFTRLGLHPMAIPTAITVQNSIGVAQVSPLSPELVTRQLENLVGDMPPHALKTGMLADDEIVRAVGKVIAARRLDNLIVDPIRHASSGPELLSESGFSAMVTHLLPHATLITPNRQEAEALWGHPVVTEKDAARCAAALRELGCRAVLVTGGHLEDKAHVVDTLADEGGVTTWRHPRHPGPVPHGTGCALSAAITAHMACGVPLRESIRRGLLYVRNAIRFAIAPGSGKPYMGDGRYDDGDGEGNQ